jgi:galactokinase
MYGFQHNIEEHLRRIGIHEPEIAAKTHWFKQATEALRDYGHSPGPQTHAYYVPGRIEFLGKHTDYAGGRSLLCTVERGICAIVHPRNDNNIRILDVRRKQQTEFPFAKSIQQEKTGWVNYPMTVAQRLANNFPQAKHGIDMTFASDLPSAAGMSSSSALTVAVFMALAERNDLQDTAEYKQNIRTREGLSGFLACIENGKSYGTLEGSAGVGTHGGSEDHTAILCSQRGMLQQYSFCPITYERSVRLPEEMVLAIAISGITASKTDNARETYNHAAFAMQRILALWREATGRNDTSLIAAVQSSAHAREELNKLLLRSNDTQFPGEKLARRAEQCITESMETIPAAVAAIEACDYSRLGELVDRSQREGALALENQVPETDFLARTARDLGANAASAFGAGFGGSVWALVKEANADVLIAEWKEKYATSFPDAAVDAEFITTHPGPAAQGFSFW